MNVNMFDTEKIAGKFTLNLLQVEEPQYCHRKYYPQRPRIDTNIDDQLFNVNLSPWFFGLHLL